MNTETDPSDPQSFFNRMPVVITLLLLGTVVLLAHIVAAIWLSMTLSNWMSGAAIGLFLIIFALAHLLIPGHTRNRVVNMNKQVLYWIIAAVSGLLAGIIAVLIVPVIGWFVVLFGVTGAVSIGRLLDGNPKTKAVRLLLFGFVGGITYLSFVFPVSLFSNIGIALFIGACAVLVGFIAHLTVGPRKKR